MQDDYAYSVLLSLAPLYGERYMDYLVLTGRENDSRKILMFLKENFVYTRDLDAFDEALFARFNSAMEEAYTIGSDASNYTKGLGRYDRKAIVEAFDNITDDCREKFDAIKYKFAYAMYEEYFRLLEKYEKDLLHELIFKSIGENTLKIPRKYVFKDSDLDDKEIDYSNCVLPRTLIAMIYCLDRNKSMFERMQSSKIPALEDLANKYKNNIRCRYFLPTTLDNLVRTVTREHITSFVQFLKNQNLVTTRKTENLKMFNAWYDETSGMLSLITRDYLFTGDKYYVIFDISDKETTVSLYIENEDSLVDKLLAEYKYSHGKSDYKLFDMTGVLEEENTNFRSFYVTIGAFTDLVSYVESLVKAE